MTDVTPILSSAGSSSTSSSSGLSVGGAQKANAKANPFDDMLNSVQTVSVPSTKKTIVSDKQSTAANLVTSVALAKTDGTSKIKAVSTPEKASVTESPNDQAALSTRSDQPFVPDQKVAIPQKTASNNLAAQEEASKDDDQNIGNNNNLTVASSGDDSEYALPAVKKLSQNSVDLLASVGVHLDQDDDDNSVSGWLPEKEEIQTAQASETAAQKNVNYNAGFLSTLKTGWDAASTSETASVDDIKTANDTLSEDLSTESDDQTHPSNDVATNGLVGLAATLAASPVLASVVQAAVTQQQNSANNQDTVSLKAATESKDVTSISGSKGRGWDYSAASDFSVNSAAADPKTIVSDNQSVITNSARISVDGSKAAFSLPKETGISVTDKPALAIKAGDSKSTITNLTSALMARVNGDDAVSAPINPPVSVADNVMDVLKQGTRDNSDVSASVSESAAVDASQTSISEDNGKETIAVNNSLPAAAPVEAAVTPPITTASVDHNKAIPGISTGTPSHSQKGGAQDSHGTEIGKTALNSSESLGQNTQRDMDAASASLAAANNVLSNVNAQSVDNNSQGNGYKLTSKNQVGSFFGAEGVSNRSIAASITSDIKASAKKDVEVENIHSEENIATADNSDFSTAIASATNLASANDKAAIDSNNLSLSNVMPNQDQVNVNNQLDLAHQSLWLDQLTRDIATASGSNSNLTFNLHPDHLGMLNVSIQSAGDGVAVHMTASSEAAQSIIANARHDLMNEAHSQGVHITDARIDLNSQTMSQQSGQNGQQANQQMADQQRSNAAAPIINNTRNEQPDDDLAEEQKNRARYA